MGGLAQNAKAMGIQFVKAKVAKITEDENQNPVLRVELIDEESRVTEFSHDLVVLSTGLLPGYDPQEMYQVEIDEDGFIYVPDPNFNPTVTDQEGIFAAGTAAGPMDIVDSITMASAAASEASAYIRACRNGSDSLPIVEEMEAVHA